MRTLLCQYFVLVRYYEKVTVRMTVTKSNCTTPKLDASLKAIMDVGAFVNNDIRCNNDMQNPWKPMFDSKMLFAIAQYMPASDMIKSLALTCREWRKVILSDKVWEDVVKRECPFSYLRPHECDSTWLDVYIVERTRASTDVPLPMSLTEETTDKNIHLSIQVQLRTSRFLQSLTVEQYAILQSPVRLWKRRKFKRDGWKAMSLTLNENTVIVQPVKSKKDPQMQKIPLQHLVRSIIHTLSIKHDADEARWTCL
jgi:hypothetical protein